MLLQIFSLGVATVCAFLALNIRMPGGMIVGGMVGSAAISLIFGSFAVPDFARFVIIVGVGMSLGTLVTRELTSTLRYQFAPALAAAILLIVAGVAISLLLRLLAIAPAGVGLATSPGALSFLGTAALEFDVDASVIVLFHLARITLILLLLPVLVRLSRSGTQQLSSRLDVRDGPAMPLKHLPNSLLNAASPQTAVSWYRWKRTIVAGVGAAIGGYLAVLLAFPGGLVVATALGSSVASLSFRRAENLPVTIRYGIHIGLGWLFGSNVTRESISLLRASLLAAALSALLIVLAGLAIGYGLHRLGYISSSYALATSPGAFEVLIPLAAEVQSDPLQVALFHTVRIVLVIASLPLLIPLLI